ncbi:hypothetical protein [Mycolicibacterium holsaticum]|uniref:hypothetical protein n=1 Tax=Mycolicibacterium holsaticum TaxID=152142 RepID=UPI0010427625|nr:hypothetical protein [Mycolicibacterium holsaticum]
MAEIDRYWKWELSREVSNFAAGVFDRDYSDDERKAFWGPQQGAAEQAPNEIEPQLNILAYGHPDPDVRRAADVFGRRMQGVVFCHDVQRARRKDGKEATTAIQLAHTGLRELRRAAYQAPFQVNRPEPDYDGIGIVEPLPSQLNE